MNKKLIALAVAGACVAPAAMAQTANPVTLYGLLDVTFERVDAGGGTAANVPTRNRLTNQASRLGVRGTEDLGGGLKAFFQIEMQVAPDDGCQQGITAPVAPNQNVPNAPNGACLAATAATGTGNTVNTGRALASRNSAVGLQGGFGSVIIGRWDTPYKLSSLGADPWGDVTFMAYTTVVHDQGAFDRRENNAVQWWSPAWGPISMRLHHSVDEGRTATVDPRTWSASVTYAAGPLALSYSWEQHKDQTGNNPVAGATETGNEFSGVFTIGTAKLSAMYERIKKEVATGTANPDQKNWFVAADWTFSGPHSLVFTYGRKKLDDTATSVLNDTKATSLGYRYTFSKRSMIYAMWGKVQNEANIASNFGNNSLVISNGQSPKGFGVGMQHKF